ncbi:MAG TPA: DUF5677 domain-containing protein [Candidatus Polarisedimenticolia bacterium]|nr:DUF5677 domain-containing protein [Candidatus Polarisedimenticolia bacterium]
MEAGFSDKAFGMTRTLVDIYITLRYIANKDTEERASLFYWFEYRFEYRFEAKEIHSWNDIGFEFLAPLCLLAFWLFLHAASRSPINSQVALVA